MFYSRRKFLAGLASGLFLLVGVVQGQAPGVVAAGAPPATVYLIRHAEKLTDGREDLSERGFERAKVLANLFVPTPGSGRVPLTRPEVLIATHRSAHSDRPVETITKLAEALKLPIQHEVKNEDYEDLARDLLSGKYAGKVVLVSWHHGKLPQLATALGVKPPYAPWPDEQFDRIWRIDWHNGVAQLTDLPQGLLQGDSK